MEDAIVYALLSARVYDASDRNRTYVPAGWEKLDWQKDDGSTGFSAGAYINEASGEIVISYTGTNDHLLDWVNNIFAGGGLAVAPQVVQAMLFYEKIKSEHPDANITFTGHSLGGGLASLMSVFFDKKKNGVREQLKKRGQRTISLTFDSSNTLSRKTVYAQTTTVSAGGYSPARHSTRQQPPGLLLR